MVSLEDAVIIRHKNSGETYEILVDADNALNFRGGADIPMDDILAVEQVFKDSAKGDKASDEHLLELYKLKDIPSVIVDILKRGELHLTTEQRRRMLDERRKQVAAIITKNSINPQTRTPHPLNRIEAAMDEAKVDITIAKSAGEQVEKVLKALKPILPIRFEKIQVALKIPAQYGGKLYHTLNELGEIKKDEWGSSEQFILIEIPAGLQDELFNRLNSATHGEVKTKVLKND
jgi:ribosome maturation protein SDO1